MKNEIEKINKFATKWQRNSNSLTSTVNEIEEVENKLNIKLPKSYKYLVQKYGDIYTPDILDAIVDKELDFADVQNFILPRQAVEDTLAYEEAGMPKGYFAFASDCMGNMFCFKLDECYDCDKEPPIWFFDHDFVEINKISECLIEWLESYIEI